MAVRAVFRADASLEIGTGHILRCLTLADALRASGSECFFVARDHIGNLHELVEARGYPLLRLGEGDSVKVRGSTGGYAQWLGVDPMRDADDTRDQLSGLSVDLLVVDHYGLDARWERSLRPICKRIMAVDDLANREHAVDVLLDQNLGKSPQDYEGRVPHSCKLFLGPSFALLRPEFSAQRRASLRRRQEGQLRKVLVTMGGVDLENSTAMVLEALNAWGPPASLDVTVVLGPTFPWADHVLQQVKRLSFNSEVKVNVRDMAELMRDADLAIGAAGSTSWERCCMGLPTLQLVLAENQRPIADALGRAGAAHLLDPVALRSSLVAAMEQLIGDTTMLLRMSNIAAQLVDGHGAERVACLLNEGL